MKKLQTLVLSAICIAFLAGAASAADDAAMTRMGPRHAMAQLTPEKQALVEKIQREQGQVVFDLRHQLMSKRHTLRFELAAKTPDAKTLQALPKDISDLEAKLVTAEIAMADAYRKNDIPWRGHGMKAGMGGRHEGRGMGEGCMMMDK